MRQSLALETIKDCIRYGENAMLISGPGVGKSEIVMQGAEEMDMDCLVTFPALNDPTDWKGLPNLKSADWTPIGDLKQIQNAKRPLVVFIDELGKATVQVQGAVAQLVQSRRINNEPIPDHVRFVAATNRRQDRAGDNAIPEHIKSRFILINLDCDVDDWLNWYWKTGLPPEVGAFIEFRPELLFQFSPSPDITAYPCPRTVHAVARWVDRGRGMDFDFLSGITGEAWASEFVGFMKVFNSLTPIKDILADPDNAPVPTDAATIYATCGSLARYASTHEESWEDILTYARRMRHEFTTLLVTNATKQNEALMETSAYINWETGRKV